MSPHRVASWTRSAVSICLVLVLAGAAWFVLPATVGATPVTDTGAVTDVVEETLPDTGGATDPVEEVVEETLPDTGGVTQPVEGVVEETLPDTGGVTQPVEEVVEETVPGGGTTDPVEDLTGSIEKTVGSVEGGSLDEITEPVTGPVVESVDKTVGVAADSPNANHRTQTQRGSGGFVRGGSPAELFPHEFSGPSAGNPQRDLRIAPTSAPAPSGPGLIERIAQAALDAAKKVAFPLALALIAGAFIVLQGRIDRRDPKLAAAPIEIDEQLLRFE
ncbi:MAG: hypothetical protein ACRDKB_14470 [Actinomycetota bacterium]